ncbi:hypothetical protein BH18ACT13_BH18ACT13_19260 [soil metagenome]
MRSDLWRATRALLFPTFVLLAILAFLPGRREIAIRIYALVVAAVALALMVALLRRAYPRAAALRMPAKQRSATRRDAPVVLARLEQEVALGSAGSFDLHHQLRPRLRALAEELLMARRRVSLDGDAEKAREVLGEETWELVRGDRLPPEDRLARGLEPDALGRVVTSLERI